MTFIRRAVIKLAVVVHDSKCASLHTLGLLRVGSGLFYPAPTDCIGLRLGLRPAVSHV